MRTVTLFGVLGPLALIWPSAAVARDPRLAPEALPHAALGAGPEAAGGAGDLVYRMAETRSPMPLLQVFSEGELHADGIHLDAPGGGVLVRYSITLLAFGQEHLGFCSGNETDSPWEVTTALWADTVGDPQVGVPMAPIAGTECHFGGIPKSSLVTLECEPGAGVVIPGAFWLTLDVFDDGDCAFWVISAADPEVGSSGDDFCISPDAGDSWTCGIDFTDPDLFANFYGVEVVIEGRPWACCDLASYECVNVQETECEALDGVFAEGTLCNDLVQPCSQAGACCNTATGWCENGFASSCTGFLESFAPGVTCDAVVCDVPPNVPTISQWGMLVLSLLLLSGMTARFGRCAAVTSENRTCGSAGASPSRLADARSGR